MMVGTDDQMAALTNRSENVYVIGQRLSEFPRTADVRLPFAAGSGWGTKHSDGEPDTEIRTHDLLVRRHATPSYLIDSHVRQSRT
jgi:hypothetical protein